VSRRPAEAVRRRFRYAAAGLLVLVLVTGCGSARHKSDPAKANFLAAADRICDSHLESVLAWLQRSPTHRGWKQLAVRDGGLYDIIGHTIHRLEALGPAPGPHAAAFTGYVKTLEARAALYRLTSMADLRGDARFLQRLSQAVDEMNGIGDAAAHSYGLRTCGASLGDLANRKLA
jgi:hypothetical protein